MRGVTEKAAFSTGSGASQRVNRACRRDGYGKNAAR
jgi:hypothetical protein